MRDNNVYEMIDLSHIPEVNRVLAGMVKEWQKKKPPVQKVNKYEDQRQTYYESMFSEPYRHWLEQNSAGPGDQPPFFWFELLQYETFQWRVVHMQPMDLAYNHQNEILPTDIVEQLGGSVVNPDEIVNLKGLRSKLQDKTVDVRFVRYSSTLIFGVVKEHAPGNTCRDDDMRPAFTAFFDYRDKFRAEVYKFSATFALDLFPELVAYETETESTPVTEGETTPGRLLEIAPPNFLSKPVEDGKDVNLFCLITLSRVREFNEAAMYELKILKEGALKEAVETYQNKKAYYIENMLRYFKQKYGGNDHGAPPYFFVLSKFAPYNWGMTKIFPWPPPSLPHKEVLPECIYDVLARTPVDPDTVMGHSPSFYHRLAQQLNVIWVRYSSNCIMGVAHEDLNLWKSLLKIRSIINDPPTEETISLYHMLFFHMRRNPEVAKSFINRFNTEMVPRLKAKTRIRKPLLKIGSKKGGRRG